MIVSGAASGKMARMDEAEFWQSGPKVVVDQDNDGYAISIRFWPERADIIPLPMQRLLAKVSSTLLVIRATLPPDALAGIRRADVSINGGRSPVQDSKGDLKLGVRNPKLRARLHTAIEALGAIARLGWEHGRIPEA